MFKGIFAAVVGGNPTSWAALAAAVVVSLAASFAGGALWQASRDVKAAVSAAPVAAKAQHDHDVKQHTDAVKADAPIVAADKGRDKALDAVLAAMAKQPEPQKSCDWSTDVAELLNDAGH